MAPARIDPSLAEALNDEDSAATPLNVFLKVDLPKAATSAEREGQARDVVERVRRALKLTPKVQYRELDRTLHVLAPREFVKALVEQPEVVAASAAPSFDSALIPPIGVKDVDPKAIDRPLRKQEK